MEKSKKKTMLIVIACVAAVLIVGVSVALGVIFSTLKGEDYVYQWTAEQTFDAATDTFEVQKNVGEEFEILQLTDLQLWDRSSENKRTYEIAEKLIVESQPDLVVLTGDNVSGIGVPELTKELTEFMEILAKKHDFVWAPIFGNHDTEMRASKNWVGDVYESASVDNGGHCLFRKGPTNLSDEYGDILGNYVVNVIEEGKIVQSLYMIDNSTYKYYSADVVTQAGRGNRECPITYSQIAWYEWNATNINAIAGYVVPQLAFTHFALSEAGEAFDASEYYGENGKLNKTEDADFDDLPRDAAGQWVVINNDKVQNYVTYNTDTTGTRNSSYGYRPGTPLINTGFVDTAKPLGLKGAFFGHDHESDAVVMFEGVIYGYGLKCGPSPRPWNDAIEYGGTSITFNEDGADIAVEHIVSQLAADYWGK